MNRSLKTIALAAGLLSIGCGSSDGGFNPNPVIPAPPIAVNDSFQVAGNGNLQVQAPGVLANDTPNGATPSVQTAPTQGTVTLSANGSFSYTPNNGFANQVDTFSYTLSNGFGSSTATVTIQIGGQGFFVKNDAPGGGNGSQANPFNTLAAAVAAATGVNGAQIVVFRGNGTSSGQNVAVALGANQSIVAQDPAQRPTISGPITLANNCTLSDLNLVGATGGDAVIGTGIAGATLTNLNITDSQVNAINLTNPTGTVTMNNLVMADLGRAAFPLSANAGSLTVIANNWTVTNTVGNVSEAEISGNAVVNASFNGMVFSDLGATNPNITNSGTGFWWETLTTSNVTLRVNGLNQDTGGLGVNFTSEGDSRTAVLISNSDIRNGIDTALALNAFGNSLLKTRVTNSRLLDNFSGFLAQTLGTADLCARLVGNTSDEYDFIGGSAVPLRVENLTGLGDPGGENIGTLLPPAGNVQNAAVDSCGIPE